MAQEFNSREDAIKQLNVVKAEVSRLEDIVKNFPEKRKPRAIPYPIEELALRIAKNQLGDELIVGDYIDIKLITDEVVRAVVVGKNHDTLAHGGALANYTFAILNLDMKYPMNENCTNKGGWAESKMRNVYIQRILKLLPKELVDNISPVFKPTSVGGARSKIIATLDKLFLLSEIEIYGKLRYSFKGEGEQYEFFKSEDNRNFERFLWLRSPCYDDSSYFCFAYFRSNGYAYYANYYYGLALGFCLSSLI